MCGIAGLINLHSKHSPALETLQRMILALHHRGPDEFGIYRDTTAGLASARLSIIDLSGGQQPMTNEDGSLRIVFNGEIFNYIELRPALEAKGHQFATQSDTEVILHLYEEYGPDCLNHLNGQFAIAIWDTRQRSLLLARDRLGIRPIFYTEHQGQLAFASEIKSFLALPGWNPVIDPAALEQIFTYWSPLSPRSIFQGVQEVPPAHYLLLKDGAIQVRPYWSLDFTEDTQRKSDEAYVEEFSSLLVDAAQIRLRADVPVGAYLSGGLDSSTTAAIIRNYSNANLDTFSIAFSTPQFNESEFQVQMAQFLGTHHQVVECRPEDIGRVFPEVIWHTEIPILRTSPAPMFLLSDLVHRNNYKVVLTGEGADEILGGYDIFKEMKIRRFVARHPESELRPLLYKKIYPDIPRLSQSGGFLSAFFARDLLNTGSPYYSHSIRWSNTARTLRFFAGRNGTPPELPTTENNLLHLPEKFKDWSPLAKAQYLEITTFMSPYLLSSQGDRPAMAHSVEGRFPFLDFRVVEFCNRLPADLKLRGLSEKYLLRQFGKKILPPEIWKRTKRPYRAPIQRSFFSDNAPEYVLELLSTQALQTSGYFNPVAVGKLVQKARSENELSEVEEMALVGILSTQLLHQMYVQRNHAVTTSTTAPLRITEQVY